MARIIKNPDVRRLEIIQAAEKLFEKKGYAKASVESIIKEANIAKGTFYYYFKAKKDVLEALVTQIGTEMEIYYNSIIENNKLTAIQKLKLLLRGEKKKKITSSIAMKIIHKPENRELQEKLNIKTVKVIAPLIAKVFEEGKKEGTFSQSLSEEIIQLILAGSQFVLDSGLFTWSSKKRLKFLNALQKLFELMLGVTAGKLNFISNE